MNGIPILGASIYIAVFFISLVRSKISTQFKQSPADWSVYGYAQRKITNDFRCTLEINDDFHK